MHLCKGTKGNEGFIRPALGTTREFRLEFLSQVKMTELALLTLPTRLFPIQRPNSASFFNLFQIYSSHLTHSTIAAMHVPVVFCARETHICFLRTNVKVIQDSDSQGNHHLCCHDPACTYCLWMFHSLETT